MQSPPQTRKKLQVTCKLCKLPMHRYRGSKLWHCTNLDMSHRGLVPDGDVPRYREIVGESRRPKSARKAPLQFARLRDAKAKGLRRRDLVRLEEVEI